MKINLSVFIVSILLLSAGCTGKGRGNPATAGNVVSKEGGAINIDRAAFLAKVYNFEKYPDRWVFEGDLPVIVDFYAEWCAPCRMIAPILDDLAREYEGRIRIYKVDTDQERELARIFNVRTLPTLLFIPLHGRPQMTMGALPKESFRQVIEEFLLPSVEKPNN